jgi:hypothetical protein
LGIPQPLPFGKYYREPFLNASHGPLGRLLITDGQIAVSDVLLRTSYGCCTVFRVKEKDLVNYRRRLLADGLAAEINRWPKRFALSAV